MKIQSYNRFDNTFRSLSVVILVFLAALLVAPNALAGKCFDKDGNLKPKAKPSCRQQFPSNQMNTSARLYDEYEHFVEDFPRDFVQYGLEFESGDYVTDDLVQPIKVDTSKLLSTSKGNPRDLCREIEDGIELYAEEFSYGWADDCRDGDCAIEIRLTFGGSGTDSASDILELSGGKSDQVDFVLNSVINSTDPNPFAVERHIPISSTVADFKKTGTTRTLVHCEYTTGGWGSPWFHSNPR